MACADLISPPESSDPGILAILYAETLRFVARIPIGLLFGLPAVAALRERIARRRWTWVEWSAASASALCLLPVVIMERGNLGPISPEGLGVRSLAIAWIMIIAFISHLILDRFSGRWNRWVQGPTNPDQSFPDSESDAKIL